MTAHDNLPTNERAEDRNLYRQVVVRMSPSMVERIDAAGRGPALSRSATIRVLLARALESGDAA